jgi:hypothetical protein
MTIERTPLHTRTITLEGYARSDGLFDVDARLTDIKHYRMTNWPGGVLDAGDPMHDMLVTMTVDAQGVIRDMKARAQSHPHAVCQQAAINFSRLIGLSIRKGFMKAVAERLEQRDACTHIREMLQQMATVAFQSMREARQKSYGAREVSKPVLLDSCKAWASDGEWVKVRFPAFYTGTDTLPDGAVNRGSFEQRLRDEGYSEPEIRRAAPDGFNDTHTHDFDVLALVLSGEVTLTCAGQSTTYRPGDILSLAAHTPHTERFGPTGYKFMIGRRPRASAPSVPAMSSLPGR